MSLASEDSRRICYTVLNDQQKAKFEESRELDFSFEVKGVARYRANYFFFKKHSFRRFSSGPC